MIEASILLLAAHIVADFVLQVDAIIRNKRKAPWFGLHIAVVLVAAILFTGSTDPVMLVVLGITHAALDGWKVRRDAAEGPPPGRQSAAYRRWASARFDRFVIDQGGHLLAIALIVLLRPGLAVDGLWAVPSTGFPIGQALPFAEAVRTIAWAAGLMASVRTGQFLIQLYMARFVVPGTARGLDSAGLHIGWWERGLAFLMAALGQYDAIAFLITAKSIFRFEAIRSARAEAEYVIIGTLASIGWAVLCGTLTAWAVARL